MADKSVNELVAINAIASGDLIPVYDASESGDEKLKKAAADNLITVSARYYQNINQPIASGAWATVNFDVKNWDSHNAVTTGSNWVFTCPVSGLYRVTSYIHTEVVAWGGGSSYGIGLWKGSSQTDLMGYVWIPSNSSYTNSGSVWGSAVANCDANNTLYVKFIQWRSANTGLQRDSLSTWISIDRIGNKIT